jgi:hypothetical protein
MITNPEYFDALTARLEAHGFPKAVAEAIAAEVGDCPLITGDQVTAVIDGTERRFPAALLED